jgi:DNA-binding protein YbaB
MMSETLYDCRTLLINGSLLSPEAPMLEIVREAHHDATRKTDGVTGKELSKIDGINKRL